MLDKAMRLCEADFGTMFAVASESARVVAARDVPAELSDFLAQHPPEIGPDTFFGRAVLGRSVLHTTDMRREAAYQSGQPLTLTAVDRAGVRALLMAPLLKEEGVSGVFAIFRREVRPFTDKQIALLQNFAAQAVIAMENARLLDELRQRTDQVGELNRGLEARVAEQVEELGRVGRLKRFLAPQLAELIVSRGDEKILESHRREIVVVFCDLRGYTAFTETAEPEEVLDFLPRVPRRAGATCEPIRGNPRPVYRRRDHGVLQ
jgi:adenylate cyclase